MYAAPLARLLFTYMGGQCLLDCCTGRVSQVAGHATGSGRWDGNNLKGKTTHCLQILLQNIWFGCAMDLL